MPAFSIIVPAYNMQDHLEEALESIAGQTFTNFEAIVVDDGSTDATGVIAKRFCAMDSRFRYLRRQNGGLSAARNSGTSVAVGTYIYYLDSDDIIDTGALSTCYRELTNQKIDVVLFEGEVFPIDSPMYRLEADYFQRPVGNSPLWSDDFIIESLRQGRYCVQVCCFVARRSAIGDLRFIEGMVFEDNHFFVSLLLEKKLRVSVLHDKLYKRRLRSGSIMFSARTLHHYDSMDRLVRELSDLSFSALKSPERATIKKEIVGNALSDLHFASSLVGPNISLRKRNVAAMWRVATHVSPRLFTPKRLLLALVPELYRLKTDAWLHR
ncbi:glycosyltransferase family 2 protein [Paraburkholderia sp. LEh10]|uniref:glycosyltransferase family 2 protein n=1 Tax=Paraburkholderia sp. LEh10 TaxID=2821353 RepID=UPI001AE6ABE5|nr:glycosyltransferase family 2 protein [Paraburkholderia sp. LEh10]MBP0588537.1 glycosyltransferase family 2 protein [Paraburkholderia sp. LEh10]